MSWADMLILSLAVIVTRLLTVSYEELLECEMVLQLSTNAVGVCALL
jgi:hypothetical protein